MIIRSKCPTSSRTASPKLRSFYGLSAGITVYISARSEKTKWVLFQRNRMISWISRYQKHCLRKKSGNASCGLSSLFRTIMKKSSCRWTWIPMFNNLTVTRIRFGADMHGSNFRHFPRASQGDQCCNYCSIVV